MKKFVFLFFCLALTACGSKEENVYSIEGFQLGSDWQTCSNQIENEILQTNAAVLLWSNHFHFSEVVSLDENEIRLYFPESSNVSHLDLTFDGSETNSKLVFMSARYRKNPDTNEIQNALTNLFGEAVKTDQSGNNISLSYTNKEAAADFGYEIKGSEILYPVLSYELPEISE